MNDAVLTAIRTRYNTLSNVQQRIADFVLKNPGRTVLMTISDIASECDTSETTILRFLHKLSFSSYQVFRVQLAQDAARDPAQAVYEEIDSTDTISDIRKKVVISTSQSINDLNRAMPDEQLEHAVSLLLGAKRIVTMGAGASSFIAQDAYHKFARIGLNATAVTDSHLMSIVCSHAGPGDLIFAVSHSGESTEIMDALRELPPGAARVLALTSYQNSTITRRADCVLFSSTNETRYRSDAMTSRILQLVIIDILYVATVVHLGPDGIEKVNRSRLAVASKKI